jgi:ankyrin repeat protein
VIIALLRAGADIKDRSTTLGLTVLILSSQHNPNPEIIKALMKAGAEAKAQDHYGKTAYDYAKENEKLKNSDVVTLLENALH